MGGTGIAPLCMVISEPVFQRDGIGENHKSQLLRRVSVIRFARCEVMSQRHFFQRTGGTSAEQFMTDSPLGGRSGQQGRGSEGRGWAPQGPASPLHLPRPHHLDCPQALPALRPSAPASRGAPTGVLGGGPSVSYWGPVVDVDEGVRRGLDGDGRQQGGQQGQQQGQQGQQGDPGRLLGAGTSPLLVRQISLVTKL